MATSEKQISKKLRDINYECDKLLNWLLDKNNSFVTIFSRNMVIIVVFYLKPVLCFKLLFWSFLLF